MIYPFDLVSLVVLFFNFFILIDNSHHKVLGVELVITRNVGLFFRGSCFLEGLMSGCHIQL